jgi:LAO/AO transport system kinase
VSRELPIDELIALARGGQDRAIGLLISEIEGPSDARRVLDHLVGLPRTCHTVGVTGPPGAGKSTLTGRLASSLIEAGSTVAVVAVDPSSPFTGGALLGDRVRMDWSVGSRPYMRSMATRGAPGGIANATGDAVDLLCALGFKYVIIETVGAGQNDLAIAGIADTVLVVSVPGLGDSVQAEKAGTYEIADIHVVNKADRPGATQLANDLRSIGGVRGGWEVPVLLTTATEGIGVEELRIRIEAHADHLTESGERDERRRTRVRTRLITAAQSKAAAATLDALRDAKLLFRLADEVVTGRLSVYQALDQVLPANLDSSLQRIGDES